LAGDQAEAYVDSEDPVLFMHDLKRTARAGALGLLVGNFAPAHFSNFEYRVERPVLKGRASETSPAPEGSVMAWAVSDSFDGTRLDGTRSLTAADLESRRWTPLAAEPSGIANLARVQGIAAGADTAFVRLRLRSAAAAVRPLELGYSDRVRVYLDGELLYSGDNTYQSRAFRYLGTIGLFDSLPLRLRAGDNELILAVSEAFGGWGIQARLPDREGIEILP
jgi:hypothetical protein